MERWLTKFDDGLVMGWGWILNMCDVLSGFWFFPSNAIA